MRPLCQNHPQAGSEGPAEVKSPPIIKGDQPGCGQAAGLNQPRVKLSLQEDRAAGNPGQNRLTVPVRAKKEVHQHGVPAEAIQEEVPAGAQAAQEAGCEVPPEARHAVRQAALRAAQKVHQAVPEKENRK